MRRPSAPRAGVVSLVLLAACGGGDDGDGETCPSVLEDETLAGGARFAGAVAIGPDVDGDGHPDVVLGEPSAPQSSELGRVSLVAGATGEVLRSWDAVEPGDRFGARVALGPDVDGDGAGDVLVAAPEHDVGRGQVTLFSGATGEPLQVWDGEEYAWLGRSVSLGPDVDGDGRGDVLISDELGYDEEIDGDILHARRGRVYLYSGATGEPLVTLDAPRHDTRFGATVQLGPDVDGDGAGDLLITDPDDGERRAGLVHLYAGDGGALLHTWSADPQTYYFGSAASLGSDVGGDGVPDVAIAMTDTSTIEERVVVYAGATDEEVRTLRDDNWRVLQPGRLVIADLDGDDRAEVVIGADAVSAGAGESATTTYVFSGADGTELASWPHAEHRYFNTNAVAAAADGPGCAALVAIGVVEDDPLDGPVAGHLELRRLH